MFKDRLNEIMKEKNITTQVLSEKTGITLYSLNDYRSGKRKEPSFSKGIKISDALDVDPHVLLEEELRS